MAEENNTNVYNSRWTGNEIDTVIGFFHNNSKLITETLPLMDKEIDELETKIINLSAKISGNEVIGKFSEYLPLTGGFLKDSGFIASRKKGDSYTSAKESALIRMTSVEGAYRPVYSLASKKDNSGNITESFSCGVTADNTLSFRHLTGTTSTEMFYGTPEGILMGAAWNDYAEFRKSNEQEPGRVICENGDGSLSCSYKRLQPGAEIISDTFGFAIGKTDECQTPVAVTGRVLAYTYEDQQIFEPGDPVCAGPNGTVSKMTREEVREYPDRMIGTVSELPSYEYWGKRKIPVNGRIWIRIK